MSDSVEATDKLPHDSDDHEASRPLRPRRACLPVVLGLVVALLVCFVGISAVWWQGTLPRWLTLQALNRSLTAHIDLGAVAIDKTFRIESLGLSQPERLDTAPPTLYIEGLEATYTPFPSDGRYIDHLHLDLFQFQADLDRDPPTTQWLFDWAVQSADQQGDTSMPFIPKTLTINVFDGGYKSPDFLLAVRDLKVTGAFPGPGRRIFDFSGDSLQLIEQVMGDDAESALKDGENVAQTFSGTGSGRVSIANNTIEAAVAVTIPDTMELEGNATLRTVPEGTSGEIAIDYLTLTQQVWGELASSWLPTPLAFEQLTLHAFAASGGIYLHAFEIDTASFEGDASAFRLGPEEAPYIQGDLRLSGEGSSASGRAAFQGSASLNEAPVVAIDFAGVPREWQLGLRTSAWAREDLQNHLPALAPLLHILTPLSDLSGDFKLLHRNGRNDFNLQASGNAAAHGLRLDTAGALGGEALLAGEGTLNYREGQAQGPFAYRSPQDFTVELALDRVNPAQWLSGLLGNEALSALDAPASGRADIRAEGPDLYFNLAASLDHLRYNDRPYHEGGDGRFEAAGAYHIPSALATGSRLYLGLGDTLEATLQNWRAESDGARLQGSASLSADLADLAAVAPRFGLQGLWGDVQATGPLQVENGELRFEAALASEGFGYGDWATPYNVPIQATTTIDVNRDGTIRLTPIDVRLGDELQVNAARMELIQHDSGTTLELSELAAEGTLRTFVTLGLFAAAEGHSAIEAATLRYIDGDWHGDFAISLEATELLLPGEVAKLNDTMLSGAFQYNGGLEGNGRLNIGLLNVGGATLSDFGSDVRAEGSHLHFEEIATDLFYGRIEGNGRVNVFDPRFPFHLEVDATNLDLARFTESFEPPDTELTGLVSGEIMIDLDLEGLKDLRVNLEAPDGITLNRSAVELILLSQQVGEFTAGGTLTKVVQRVIGEAPHRPFESASLQLGFEDGRITGVALLQSQALNLTVDIKADPGAIAEALRIRTE